MQDDTHFNDSSSPTSEIRSHSIEEKEDNDDIQQFKLQHNSNFDDSSSQIPGVTSSSNEENKNNEHLDDDDSYIKKFYDFLPHNGKLVLYLPSSQIIWSNLDDLVNHKRRYSKKGLEKLLVSNNFKIQKIHFVDFIGWSVLLLSKLLNLRLDFDQKKIIFYDKFIFKSFKFFDILFKNLIGKNLFVVASKS